MSRQKEPLFLRFISNVRITDGCWLWTGDTGGRPYGRIKIDGRYIRAHRWSWEFANNQSVPDGLCVCHKCDTPLCVRPSHLFIGSHLDNARDRNRKGRHKWSVVPYQLRKRGEQQHLSRLTADIVRDMRRLRAEGDTYKAIGHRYGVSMNSARLACLGMTWAHVQ